MVVAEGQVMDSVGQDEGDETRPKGRVLQVGEIKRAGDLYEELRGVWRPTWMDGEPVSADEVGAYIRPEPETSTSAPQSPPTQAPEGATPIVELVEEIDAVRTVLGAREGEGLLDAAQSIRTVLGARDGETAMGAAARRAGEPIRAAVEAVNATRGLDAARARITYLEQKLAGAYRDAKALRTAHVHRIEASGETITVETRGRYCATCDSAGRREDGTEYHAAGCARDPRGFGAEVERLTAELRAEMETNTATRGRLATAEADLAAERATHEQTRARLAEVEIEAGALQAMRDDAIDARDRAQSEIDAAWTAAKTPVRGMVSLAEVITGRAVAAKETCVKLADAESRLQEIQTKRAHRAQRKADLAALAAREAQAPSVIACGTAPDDYDARAKSEDGRCPHCKEEGRLVDGYGLAAGGCGSYYMCEACGRLCDARPDDKDETSVSTPDPVADEAPRVDPGEGWRPTATGERCPSGCTETYDAGVCEGPEMQPACWECGSEMEYDDEPDPVHAPTGDMPPAQPETPRVEDATPEAQAETMRPWRGEATTIAEDEKGRWFVRRGVGGAL